MRRLGAAVESPEAEDDLMSLSLQVRAATLLTDKNISISDLLVHSHPHTPARNPIAKSSRQSARLRLLWSRFGTFLTDDRSEFEHQTTIS